MVKKYLWPLVGIVVFAVVAKILLNNFHVDKNVPISFQHNLKINDESLSSYRSPASSEKKKKKSIKSDKNQEKTSTKREKEYFGDSRGKILSSNSSREINRDALVRYESSTNQNLNTNENVERPKSKNAENKKSDLTYIGHPIGEESNTSSDSTGSGNSGSQKDPPAIKDIPIIRGRVKDLDDVVSYKYSPMSAYAANSCVSPRVLLLDLTNMSVLLDNPISEKNITESTAFEFDPVGLQLDLEHPNRYMLQTVGCSINYQRIITDYFTEQSLDPITTLVSKVINTKMMSSVTSSNPLAIDLLYKSVNKEQESNRDLENIYRTIEQNALLTQSFNATFVGGQVGDLEFAAPDLNNVIVKTSLQEKVASIYSVNAFHWNPDYTIGYEWKIGNDLRSNSYTWTYIPTANTPDNQILTLIVGKKNTNDNNVDKGHPYHEIVFDLSIENTHPALAPGIVLNTSYTDPTKVKNIAIDFSTGSLVDGVYGDCETFSKLALSEGDATPSESDFNISCQNEPFDTAPYLIKSSFDGPVQIKMWSQDIEGRISETPSVLNIVVDTTAPILNFSGIAAQYRADDTFTISWLVTEDHSSSSSTYQLDFYNGSSWANVANVSSLDGGLSNEIFQYDFQMPNANITGAKFRVTFTDTLGQSTTVESTSFNVLRPILGSTPFNLDMGQVQNLATSTQYDLFFTNSGLVDTKTCSAAVLSGAQASDFRIVSDECDGAIIAPGGSCKVTFDSTPSQKGTRSASVALSCANDTHTTNVFIESLNNAPPKAADQNYSSNEDTLYSFSVNAAIDSDGDVLTYEIVTGPANGVLSNCLQSNADLNCDYTPNLNYNGPDSFTYRSFDGLAYSQNTLVTLNVLPINDAPTLASSQSVTTDEDVTVNFLLNSGSDIENDTLTYIVVSPPTNGVLTCVGGTSNSCQFDPDPNFFGTTSFSYKVNDGSLDSNIATVTITISGVNDAPVVGADQTVNTNEDTFVNFSLNSGSDIDIPAQTLQYQLITTPTKGILSNCITTGSYSTDISCTYTPNLNQNGTDTFTYRVNDGQADSSTYATVTINIAPINDAPTLLANQSIVTNEDTPITFDLQSGSDVEGDPLTYIKITNTANGTISCVGGTSRSCTFTPNSNYNGSDSFTYKVNDGNLDSNIATVSITINPINDRPVMGANQTFATDDIVPINITLNNATDIDSGALSYKIVTPPSNGTLSNCITTGAYGTDLTCTYTPNINFNGTDSFTFIASDGSVDALSPATVTINVSDKTPAPAPIIALTSPVYTNSTAVTFTASSCSDTPMLFVNEGSAPTSGAAGWQTCTLSANAITYTMGATQGVHTVKVWAKDAYGNVSATSTNFNITYDTVLPSLALTTPPALRGGQSYNFLWNATELNTTTALNFTVDFFNGSSWSTVGTTPSTAGPLSNTPFSRSWTVASLNISNAKFRVSFTDRAGNTRTTASVDFTIDSTAPNLTIASPAANSYHKSSATLSGSCETGRDITFSGDLQTSFSITCSGGSYSQLINFSNNDGTKTIVASQTDAVGNIKTVSRSFIRDEIAPIIAKTTGVSPDFTKNNTPNTWSGTCEGNYTIYVTGSETTSFACSAGSWSWTPSPKTVDGTYSYDLVQTDAAGNTSSPPMTLSWTRDATAPLFNITSPFSLSAGATKSYTNNLSTMTFSGSCEGTNTIQVSGATADTFSCSASSWTWTTPTYSTDGLRNFTIKQTDSAGNVSTMYLNWTRDTTGPALTINQTTLKTNTDTVVFNGGCTNGLTINISGAQTTTTTCSSGMWSFTTSSFTTDANRTFNFSQTNAVPNTTSVSANWVRKTSAPAVSAFSTSANNPSRSSIIPVDLAANSNSSLVYISHFCFKSDDNTKPLYDDPCFVGVNSPAVGKPLAQSLTLDEYSHLIGWVPKNYNVYAWVKDEAQNVSNLASSGAGSLGVDRINISYDPGIPPDVWDVIAANDANATNPPSRAHSSAPAGTDVFIRWKATDNIPMPAGAVSLFYTPDEINFTEIVSGLDNANYGCSGYTLQADEGCYRWVGGSPYNSAYKIRVKVTDAGDVSSQLISNPLNSDVIKIIAGNTESGLGGSAQTAMFLTVSNTWEADPGSLVVTNDGRFFFSDYAKGILTIDLNDGKQKMFIPKTGASTGDGGPAVNATLQYAVKIALDYQGRMLIFDRDRIRRVDLNLSTPTIETIIGGGADTADNVANPLSLKINALSNNHHSARGTVFFATPNGDIYFHSEDGYKEQNINYYRIRIYKSATNSIVSKYFTGTGDAFNPSQDLMKCRFMNPGISFDINSSSLTGVTLTTLHNEGYTGCDDLNDRYSRAYFDPNTFVAIAPKDDSLRYYRYFHVTLMDGNSYVFADRTYVNKVNYDGTYTRIIGSGTRGECVDGTLATACNVSIQDLFINSLGQIYFLDSGLIRTVLSDGTVKTLFGQRPTYGNNTNALNARFDRVTTLTRLDNGKIVVGDANGFYLKEFTIEGDINVIAGDGSRVPLNTTDLATSRGLYDADWFQVNKANGEVYMRGWDYNPIYKLNRSTNKWEIVVGGGTVAYETGDGEIGSNIRVSNAQTRLLTIGFNGQYLLGARMNHDPVTNRYDNQMFKLYDRSNLWTQSHLMGIVGEYVDPRKICENDTLPAAASTCAAPYWDTVGHAGWDDIDSKWIMANRYGGSDYRKVFYIYPGGNIYYIATMPRGINSSYLHRRESGKEYLYYCDGVKIYKHNLTDNIDMGALLWPVSNMYCRGYRMDYNPTNNSIIFPFEQNALSGVAEYFLP